MTAHTSRGKEGTTIKHTVFSVPAEMIAALVEINSDLGVLIDEGIDPEAVESLELLQKQVDTLLNDVDLYERNVNPRYECNLHAGQS